MRLNSITKVFTTEVLVALAAEGKLALTDTLQRFAGEAKVPGFGTHAITLLDLATYSAAHAARDGRRPRRRKPPRLADPGGPLEMAARLHAALGARHHRRLLECRFRPAGRRHRDRRRPTLSGPAARQHHRPARDDRHRLHADAGTMRPADDRFRLWRPRDLRRHARHRGQRRPLQHRQRHGALAAPQPGRPERRAGAQPRRSIARARPCRP